MWHGMDKAIWLHMVVFLHISGSDPRNYKLIQYVMYGLMKRPYECYFATPLGW